MRNKLFSDRREGNKKAMDRELVTIVEICKTIARKHNVKEGHPGDQRELGAIASRLR
jgi:hypothetical protein